MRTPNHDPTKFFLREYEEAEQTLEFRAKKLDDAKKWQRKARAKLIQLMGGFPKKKCPLKARVLAKEEMQGYRRETIVFESMKGLQVHAYFMIPKRRASKSRVMIAVPGHGYGVDDIVGITPEGGVRAEREPYQFDYALQCVERGIPTLAIEPLSFGHRRTAQVAEGKADESSCAIQAGAALLTGKTLIGYRVYDLIRAVDYLQTRREVARNRIGLMGISGGGMLTFFAACVDPRIKVAFVSGYFNTFKNSIYSITHCIDNFVPNILNYFEMPDMVGMIAPRAVFFEQGREDQSFPLHGFRKATKRAKEVYSVFRAAQKTEWATFPGEHQFNGKKGFLFVEKWL